MPGLERRLGDVGALVWRQIGRDLEQQRRRMRGPAAARAAISRRSARITALLRCRSRRPGVFGEETLTTR